MPVMKKGSRNRWTTIDNFCFHDKSLSYKEIGLLCSMLSLPDDWKFNVRGLAALHSDGVDSVSSGLNNLIEKGYIYREQANSSKGRGIEGGERGIPAYGNPVYGKPVYGKPGYGKGVYGKSRTIKYE